MDQSYFNLKYLSFFNNIFLDFTFNFYFDFIGGVEGFPTNNEVQSQIPSQNSYYMRPYYYYPQPHYYHHPTFWYPPKMPSPPLPRTPQVPQVPQVPQMSQPLTQPPQPPELMGCANSPSCSSACLKVWNKMKIFTALTKDIIYQIISFFFQNWYNSWYYPGSHYPKAESESNSTSGSDEKALVILNIILYYFYVCIGLENGWKKMQYDISLHNDLTIGKNHFDFFM